MTDEICGQDCGPGFSHAVAVAVLVKLGCGIESGLLDLVPDEMGQSGLSVKPGREPRQLLKCESLAAALLVALSSGAAAVEAAGEFIAAEVPG